MPTVEVFDPPMCCASGVCGADPDPELARFAADLDWLRRQGIEVRRYNLAQAPSAFTENVHVRRLMQETGGDCLPVILVDGEVAHRGSSPRREELSRWAGLSEVRRTALDLPVAVDRCGGDGEKNGCCG